MNIFLFTVLGAFSTLCLSSPTSIDRDVVIIGSGPSGCTAAIYTARAMLNPLVIAGYSAGGQLMLTSDVENFPGYQNAISGPELMGDLTCQARRFGAEIWNTDCLSINTTCYPFEVKTRNSTIFARSIIISTGADAVWLNAENETDFKGKGISTCATCDGYMFRDKPIVVIGGGDSAMEEAVFLTRFASSVTLLHRRDSFRASKVMLSRAITNSKITLLTNRRVTSWLGENGVLSGAMVEDIEQGQVEEIECSGAFIAIGHKPNTAFLNNQVELDDNGYIRLMENTMTSVPGVFACGDVTDTRYRQAITAAASGCQAAIDTERWLEDQPPPHPHSSSTASDESQSHGQSQIEARGLGEGEGDGDSGSLQRNLAQKAASFFRRLSWKR